MSATCNDWHQDIGATKAGAADSVTRVGGGRHLSKSRQQSRHCFKGSAEGISIGVVIVTITISIAVAFSIIVATVTAITAAAVSSAASYSL
jgi:hypothetical protein